MRKVDKVEDEEKERQEATNGWMLTYVQRKSTIEEEGEERGREDKSLSLSLSLNIQHPMDWKIENDRKWEAVSGSGG